MYRPVSASVEGPPSAAPFFLCFAHAKAGGRRVSEGFAHKESQMPRPVTMFTGQWADLSLETLAAKCRGFGFDGLELACWGDHFEVPKALREDGYCAQKRKLLDKHNMQVFAVSAHLVGQAVLDNIDYRHQAILPP